MHATLTTGAGPLQGTSSVTLIGGVAAFAGLLDTTAESITLNYSGGGFSAGPSTVVVSPAAAAKLVLMTPPSTSGTAGQAFSTQPVLALEDQYNNVETGDNTSEVTVSPSSGSGPLQGATKITVNRGVATFTGLADNTAETIILNYSDAGFTAGPSTVDISPAAAAKLVIESEPSATATAGQAFADQPAIWEEDQFGNLETGDNATQLSASPATGAGPLVGTKTVTLEGGVAAFTNLEDDKAESLTIKFASTSLTSLPSTPITISPATTSKLAILSQVSAQARAGQSFPNQPVVAIEDRFGNVETGDNNTTVSVTPGGGTGVLLGTTQVTAKAGVATFSGLEDDKAETITLTYSGAGITDLLSGVVILPATASKLVIETLQPSPSATSRTSLREPAPSARGRPVRQRRNGRQQYRALGGADRWRRSAAQRRGHIQRRCGHLLKSGRR